MCQEIRALEALSGFDFQPSGTFSSGIGLRRASSLLLHLLLLLMAFARQKFRRSLLELHLSNAFLCSSTKRLSLLLHLHFFAQRDVLALQFVSASFLLVLLFLLFDAFERLHSRLHCHRIFYLGLWCPVLLVTLLLRVVSFAFGTAEPDNAAALHSRWWGWSRGTHGDHQRRIGALPTSVAFSYCRRACVLWSIIARASSCSCMHLPTLSPSARGLPPASHDSLLLLLLLLLLTLLGTKRHH